MSQHPTTLRRIATLTPRAQAWAHALMRALDDAGIPARIISGTRTYAEQDALYAKGRTAPGQRVTNARGGQSNHNFGLAWDIGIFSGDTYLPESPLYARAGAVGRAIGLEWGGDWTSIIDMPHFQCRVRRTVRQLDGIVRAAGGLDAAMPILDALVAPREDDDDADANPAASLQASSPLFDARRAVRVAATAALLADTAAARAAAPDLLAAAIAAASSALGGTSTGRSGAVNTLTVLASLQPEDLAPLRATLEPWLDRVRTNGPQTAGLVDDVRDLLARPAVRSTVFIQYRSAAQRPFAAALADRLRALGFSVPDLEDVGLTRGNEAATWLFDHAGAHVADAHLLRDLMEDLSLSPRTRTLTANTRAASTFEIWLAAALPADAATQLEHGCDGGCGGDADG